jgi:hypothetical protein
VNNWDNISNKVIFSRNNNMIVYLDYRSNVLYCDFIMADNSVNTIMITDNFPLQKWVHIIVSMDSGFMDCYLDGKLIKSQKVITSSGGLPAQPPDATSSPLYLGNAGPATPKNQNGVSAGFNANVANFKRWTNSMDPQTAWNTYMGGNGQSYLMSSYGANLQINKNNTPYSNVPLF